jgi:hypothetical protein
MPETVQKNFFSTMNAWKQVTILTLILITLIRLQCLWNSGFLELFLFSSCHKACYVPLQHRHTKSLLLIETVISPNNSQIEFSDTHLLSYHNLT